MSGTGPDGAVGGLTPPEPIWELAAKPDPAVVRRLQQALQLPQPLCALLAVRGLHLPDDAKAYLRPTLEALHDPALLPDAEAAAHRIARAVQGGETILVHGDYDVDGVAGTALLTRWLRHLGAHAVGFVPHRLRDGYDFGAAGLAEARRVGASLVVTVDCGTVARQAVGEARAAGLDVVVTDHHRAEGELPPALAVVNPNRPDATYPDPGLCGTGVAFKVGWLVARHLGADHAPLLEFLDLVALATVADLVPLRGENRILVHYGLRRFRDTRVPGVSALMDAAGVAPEEVSAGTIGFVLGPRLNAAGRVGEAADALRLLLTDDPDEATSIARTLEGINRARRDEDARTLSEALRLLERSYDPDRHRGVVLAAEGWHPGVIGIVASRVVERIHRPVVLVALDGEHGRGSGRSIPGFDLHAAIHACSAHLIRFGGHAQAAGLDLRRDSLEAFRAAFQSAADAALTPELLRPRVRADLEVELSDVDLEFVRWLRYLEPHGIGNPAPALLVRGVTLEGARVVGERHLKARLSDGERRVDGIGFGLAERYAPAEVEDARLDVIFRAERNEWHGTVRPQARIRALRPAAPSGGG